MVVTAPRVSNDRSFGPRKIVIRIWPSLPARRTAGSLGAEAIARRRRPRRAPLKPKQCHTRSGAREYDELLGRAGHRDIAVDGSFDACSDSALSKRVWVDEDDEVELEALRVFGGQ